METVGHKITEQSVHHTEINMETTMDNDVLKEKNIEIKQECVDYDLETDPLDEAEVKNDFKAEESSKPFSRKKKWKCLFCGFIVEKKHHQEYFLRKHYETCSPNHKVEGVYLCDICRKDCDFLDNLRMHMENSHRVFKSHKQLYTQSVKYICFYCGFAAKTLHYLRKHNDTCLNRVKGSFTCEICSCDCGSLKNLKMHMKECHDIVTLRKFYIDSMKIRKDKLGMSDSHEDTSEGDNEYNVDDTGVPTEEKMEIKNELVEDFLTNGLKEEDISVDNSEKIEIKHELNAEKIDPEETDGKIQT